MATQVPTRVTSSTQPHAKPPFSQYISVRHTGNKDQFPEELSADFLPVSAGTVGTETCKKFGDNLQNL